MYLIIWRYGDRYHYAIENNGLVVSIKSTANIRQVINAIKAFKYTVVWEYITYFD